MGRGGLIATSIAAAAKPRKRYRFKVCRAMHRVEILLEVCSGLDV
jgi:hypothetical protein